ncbi:MAG: hypothetical protein Q8S11_09890 [Daejeonella sp.]|uniref:hypothetical protein n=1 Tax=Daejeonella sp. TaxID=2805397 RepID=UPI002734C7A8|nr:hypothetical protein [Daejeonella sp.]MDP3468633.1 hypothetical protein [Daejeonella sp.]
MRTKFSSLLFIFVTLGLESFSQKQVRVIPLPDKTGFTVESSTKDLGNGFFDHGVASPISNHRGVVTTVDGNGKNIVLVWLFDHRGGYSLLMIDAETGKSEEFTIPFNPKQDTPYSSILSTSNKFYTHFSDHFTEFDPVKRAFTFTQKTMPQMAMAMTEDDKGKIWAITYPNSGMVSFDPNNRELKDYGFVHKENWRQYQRSLVADNAGWIYFGLGNASSQIIAFDPNTGKANGILPQNERKLGTAAVYRDENGKVYGRALESIKDQWYELYKGEARKIGEYNDLKPVKIITGSQSLFHRNFPDGTVLKDLDLVNRILITENPKTNTTKEVSFDYTSDGAIVMGIGTAPDGTIVGGTAFPMRFFNYDLKKDKWVNRYALGQFNALVNQNNKVYFGVYSGGHLIEWDPYKPWIQTKLNDKSSNPLHLTTVSPELIRPFRIIAHPDGKTIIMGGTPQYGATGGGLLLYDNQTNNRILLTDSMVVKDQSSMSLVPLKNGKLLAGTTTTPGSGGEKKAKEAQMYIMDMASKKIEWQQAVFPGVQEYSEMRMMPGGMVYGITDKRQFFVFDPANKQVVYKKDIFSEFGPTTAEQSPRIFVTGPKGEVYILFAKGAIVEVLPKTYEMKLIATAPGPIKAGGDFAHGRIFFVSGSHLMSYKL